MILQFVVEEGHFVEKDLAAAMDQADVLQFQRFSGTRHFGTQAAKVLSSSRGCLSFLTLKFQKY